MLIDLLNSSNYIMINRDAIRIFGLNTAIYCAELLNIYKKAVEKKKLVAENAFKVDRTYITKQTTLSVEEQIKCDLNLQKVNVINIAHEDPDVLKFNVDVFASILSSEDVKILDAVSAKVKVTNPKGTKAKQRDRMVVALKEAIKCPNYELMMLIRDWVDAIMSNPNKYLSKPQVEVFTNTLFKYCENNIEKAKEIITIATVHQYVDCQWAINLYEKSNSLTVKPAVRKTEQKRTDRENLWEGEAF